ncbi:type II toxin-antitoxin system Phd/YefM family antitoxin [Longimicrobium sp.]|uniref:type II toxin-antitoxin system Phd/YefM family antitoxin n=1 Tax=Longimicrobium sp. TaxID=2029185 RepID=UPI002C50D5EB|nr:type II toxin-antitoxin system Phd/YefM family antitoxin [Longimicrobium sp.]HSU13156.1 type II toxin-antitoxin system Phd/YefM family antitoxin [Longimicrobium sp.]
MPDLRDIYPLTDFTRNTREHIARLRETGRPAVLTVNGRSELVVQSAEAYYRLLEVVDRAETILVIQRGRADVAAGETMPLDEAFGEIRATIAP